MKVLIVTDGSEHADQAAKLLAHFSHDAPLELTVLSVCKQHEFLSSVEVIEVSQEIKLAKARAACERVEQVFEGANARVESVVAEGHPGETIIAEAEKRGIDLIVIGARGHSTFDRMMVGSVSDFVAVHSPCSVLLVRPSQLGQSSIRICVAYDGSTPCIDAIKELAEFDWHRNAKFDVVSVMTVPHMNSEIPIEIDMEAIFKDASATLDSGVQRLQAFSPNVASKLIESNDVGDAIVQFAEEKQSDIVLVGSSGRGLISRVFMGSVSRYVLRHATCSVWISKERKQSAR